jgi:pimeloyl-ACP methyl ester carboxylesterase
MDDLRLGPLAARRWHAGAPAKVLALHGWLDNAASFDRLAPWLRGLELVALDLPGHGQSDGRSAGSFYHFIDWIADVVEAARALGWARFALLAHSMGAGIAPLVAAALPEAVERLVCIEGLGPLSTPAEEAPAQLRRSLAHQVGESPPVHPDFEAAVQRLQKRGLTRAGAECLARRGTRAVPGGLVFAHDPRTRWPSRLRMTEEQVQAFLGEVRCPVLLVTASDGLPYPWEARAARVANLRHLTSTGGHHLHLDHPENVAEEIRAFLTALG